VSKIEGATGWESFWKITFPMISPVIVLNTVFTIIDNFSSVTNKLMLQMLSAARGMRIDVGSAQGWVYFLTVFLVVLVFLYFANKKTSYIVY
jgi:ABC-type sugar transport system permease subunit